MLKNNVRGTKELHDVINQINMRRIPFCRFFGVHLKVSPMRKYPIKGTICFTNVCTILKTDLVLLCNVPYIFCVVNDNLLFR